VFGVQGRHGAAGCRSDGLAVGGVDDVAGGEHAVEASHHAAPVDLQRVPAGDGEIGRVECIKIENKGKMNRRFIIALP